MPATGIFIITCLQQAYDEEGACVQACPVRPKVHDPLDVHQHAWSPACERTCNMHFQALLRSCTM
eukprot:1790166-Pleurochrysis_carterae.AAC.2